MKKNIREKLINVGLELFYSQGYEATGIQQITKVSGVPKGSFYNYFPSKEAFGIAVVNFYTDQMCARLESILIKNKLPPLTRLKSLFDLFIQTFEEEGPKGCLAGNLCQELAAKNPAFQIASEGAFRRMETYFAYCLQEAQKRGDLQKHHDIESLTHLIYNAYQGTLLRYKATQNTESLQKFVTTLFETILC